MDDQTYTYRIVDTRCMNKVVGATFMNSVHDKHVFFERMKDHVSDSKCISSSSDHEALA